MSSRPAWATEDPVSEQTKRSFQKLCKGRPRDGQVMNVGPGRTTVFSGMPTRSVSEPVLTCRGPEASKVPAKNVEMGLRATGAESRIQGRWAEERDPRAASLGSLFSFQFFSASPACCPHLHPPPPAALAPPTTSSLYSFLPTVWHLCLTHSGRLRKQGECPPAAEGIPVHDLTEEHCVLVLTLMKLVGTSLGSEQHHRAHPIPHPIPCSPLCCAALLPQLLTPCWSSNPC